MVLQKYVCYKNVAEHPLIQNKSDLYLRSIDDIFMIWTKSENELKHFMNEINQKHQ